MEQNLERRVEEESEISSSDNDEEASHVKYWLSPDTNHDCYFIVGPETGPTERIGTFKYLLMGYSEPFRAMLQDSALKEEGDIMITDIKPDTFRLLLKCLFMNCNNIADEDASFGDFVDLLYASEKYLVTFLKEKLVKHIVENYPCISVDSTLAALDSPIFLQNKRLNKLLLRNVKSKIKLVLFSPNFVKLSSEALLWILKLDNIDTDDDILWERTLEWATHNTGSKDGTVLRQYMLRHLKFIRFCTMSPDNFCQKVVPCNILDQNEVYEICTSFGLSKPPNMEFICNEINFRCKYHPESLMTLSHCVKSSFSGVSRSHKVKYLGFSWHILLIRNDTNDLSFFLVCDSLKSDWECKVKFELVLITHNGANQARLLSHKFCNSVSDWGLHHFLSWSLIEESPKKYIKHDRINVFVNLLEINL